MPTLEFLSRQALIARSGTTEARLADYLAVRLVAPVVVDGNERFTPYDANLIGLCDKGVRMGVPLESFRAIGSFCRAGFELEYPEFLGLARDNNREVQPSHVLKKVFLLQEVALEFVQNVLQAQMQAHVYQLTRTSGPHYTSPQSIIHRPSALFLERHGLEAWLQAGRDRVSRHPDDLDAWAGLGRNLTYAGCYREAAFYLEEALQKWPEERSLQHLNGLALISAGEIEAGLDRLGPLTFGPEASPLAQIYCAVGCYLSLPGLENGEGPAASCDAIRHAHAALAGSEHVSDPDRLEVKMFAGWLFTAVPAVLWEPRRGVRLLLEVLETLDAHSVQFPDLPGVRERYRVNAAYLLFECLNRGEPLPKEAHEDLPHDLSSTLEAMICQTDPFCASAKFVFLHREDR